MGARHTPVSCAPLLEQGDSNAGLIRLNVWFIVALEHDGADEGPGVSSASLVEGRGFEPAVRFWLFYTSLTITLAT